MLSLLYRRVYDIAGVSPKSTSVYLNSKKIEIKDFNQYVEMFNAASNNAEESKGEVFYEDCSPRWQIAISPSDGEFQQVSYVNAISTIRGGTHVNYITDQIVEALNDKLKKKQKDLKFKAVQIKQCLRVFVNCLIECPAFDSQTKETLTTKKDQFGSTCELSEKFKK